MSATLRHDPLLPPNPDALAPGAALAVLAHAALLVALTAAVSWRATAPEAVSAELWSAVPQVSAPPAPPPAPPATPAPAPPPLPSPRVAPAPPQAEPDPQIAIAQARREKEAREKAEREQLDRQRKAAEREKAEKAEKAAKAEQQRLDKERADKARAQKEREAEQKKREAAERSKAERAKAEQAEKDRQKADEQRLAQQRQKNLERMMGQVGGAGGSPGGTAAQTSGPSASYTGRLVAAIKPNIVFTDDISGNPVAEIEVRVGPTGSVLSRRIVRSSGNPAWDEAVARAIDRTGSLPRDVDGRVPPVLILSFRPKE